MSDARQIDQLQRRITRLEHRIAGLTAGITTGTGGTGTTDHGALTGLADDDHTQYHNDARGDARYYTESEYINTSAGMGDAGKPIVLDADGHVDATMVNDVDIDHGTIGGLADDDHTQYHNDARALTWIGPAVAAATEKATPIDADNLALADSAASNVLKRLTWANLKTTLKTYFDGLYFVLLGKAGGQTAYGGTGAGESAIIEGTSHATKGPVKLNPSGGNVNIGGTNVAQLLTLNSASAPVVQLDISNVAKGYLGIASGTDAIVTGSVAGDTVIRSQGFKALFSADSGTTPHMQLLAGGFRLRRNTDPCYFILDVDGTAVAQVRGTPGGGLKIANGAASVDWAEWNSSGNLGLRVTPQGIFHAHDGTGGMLFVTKTLSSGTAQTIIPNGTGDVIVMIRYEIIYSHAGGSGSNTGQILLTGSTTFGVSPNRITLAVAADGSVTLQRIEGTNTWTVLLQLWWL